MPTQTATDLGEGGESQKIRKDGLDWVVTNTNIAQPGIDTSAVWKGQTVVLVNRQVMSNGDISSNTLRKLGAKVVGFEGSAGSASMAGGNVKLPCIDISHTQAQTWEPGAWASGKAVVQLEANQTESGLRVGGVLPTNPLSPTRANLEGDMNWRLGKPGAVDVTLLYARRLLDDLLDDN